MRLADAARPCLAFAVYVVGHTDGTGGFEHNMELSRPRGAAAALARSHGIEARRLGSHGDGPLAPRRTNGNEGGRTQNRRVEMVAH